MPRRVDSLRLCGRGARVPDTFQLAAISAFFAFRAYRVFYNLRVFNEAKYSDSPRLHHCFCGVPSLPRGTVSVVSRARQGAPFDLAQDKFGLARALPLNGSQQARTIATSSVALTTPSGTYPDLHKPSLRAKEQSKPGIFPRLGAGRPGPPPRLSYSRGSERGTRSCLPLRRATV